MDQSQPVVSSCPTESIGGSQESLPSPSIIRATPSPESSTTRGSASDNGLTSPSPSSSLSSPSQPRHSFQGVYRRPLRMPGAPGGRRDMGGLPVQANMGGTGIFPQHPNGVIDSWAQGSSMGYPATCSAQAGPSRYGRDVPDFCNGDPDLIEIWNALNSSDGLSHADIDEILNTSLPLAGPSELPHDYEVRSGPDSLISFGPISSGEHSAGQLTVNGGDAGFDWFAFLDMPSLSGADPSQLLSHYESQSDSGYGSSSSSDVNFDHLFDFNIPTPLNDTQDEERDDGAHWFGCPNNYQG